MSSVGTEHKFIRLKHPARWATVNMFQKLKHTNATSLKHVDGVRCLYCSKHGTARSK